MFEQASGGRGPAMLMYETKHGAPIQKGAEGGTERALAQGSPEMQSGPSGQFLESALF